MIEQRPKVLVISGSARSNSTSFAISMAINSVIKNWANTSSVLACNELPLFSENLEGSDKPSVVSKTEDMIFSADGVIICSPEYNASVPGVLKNYLDWLSRPHLRGVLRNKYVALVVHTPFQKGGYGAYSDLVRILSHMGNHVQYHTKGRISGFRERDGAILREWNDDLSDVINDYRIFLENNLKNDGGNMYNQTSEKSHTNCNGVKNKNHVCQKN